MAHADESGGLWEYAHKRGMSRRRFLWLLAMGGVAAVLAACTDLPVTETTEPPSTAATKTSPWFKDPEPFIPQGDNSLESRLENMQGFLTPNQLFFVRNNSVSIDVDAADWHLSIDGDAVAAPVQLSYADLRNMPSRTVVSYLECAGNHRVMFDVVKGQPAAGTQWGTGAVGNGEWTGVPLKDVLTLAGITDDAENVLLIGMDEQSPEGGFRRVTTVEKALDPDTLLAYALNGETLPRDHGFPLRALLPGWVGSSSIKWLSKIVVASERLWTRNNTTSYVLIGDAYKPEGQALGKAVTVQVIKSALGLPWPAELSAGVHQIYGYAHSPDGPIVRVEWSVDSGSSWRDAVVLEPQVQHSWARFQFTWDVQPGRYTLMTRATDADGNVQPEDIPFNEKGYLFNQPLPHPIYVK